MFVYINYSVPLGTPDVTPDFLIQLHLGKKKKKNLTENEEAGEHASVSACHRQV